MYTPDFFTLSSTCLDVGSQGQVTIWQTLPRTTSCTCIPHSGASSGNTTPSGSFNQKNIPSKMRASCETVNVIVNEYTTRDLDLEFKFKFWAGISNKQIFNALFLRTDVYTVFCKQKASVLNCIMLINSVTCIDRKISVRVLFFDLYSLLNCISVLFVSHIMGVKSFPAALWFQVRIKQNK